MTASPPANRFHEVWESGRTAFEGGRPALVEPRPLGSGRLRYREVTYSSLLEGAGRFAGALDARGVRAGDRVLFLQPPSIELYQGIMGALKLGAVSVFVHPADGRRHFESCLARSSPAAFVGSPGAHLLRVTSPMLRRVPVKIHTGGARVPGSLAWDDLLSGGDPGFPTAAVRREDPALVGFTTGTTGAPKGVWRSHEDLARIFDSLSGHPAKRAGGVDLCAFANLPLDDLAAARTCVLAALRRDRVLETPAEWLLQQLEDHPPRMLSFPPVLLERLVDAAREQGRSFRTVEHVFVGSGVASYRLMESYRAVFPGARMSVIYGSTEVEPVSAFEVPDRLDDFRRMTAAGAGICVGRPDAVSLRIVEVAGGPLEALLDTASPGEILVAGPHVNRAYDDPDETRRHKFVEPGTGLVWHRMGDLGTLDPEGRLWLRGRKDRAMVAGANDERRVHPMAVEGRIDRIEGVRRSAVFQVELGGLRGQDLGRDPARRVTVAAVELESPGPEEAAVIRQVRDICLSEGLGTAAGSTGPMIAPDLLCVLPVREIPFDRRQGAKIDYETLERALQPRLRRELCEPSGRRLAAYLAARFPPGDHATGALVYVLGLLGLAGVAWWRTPGTVVAVTAVVLGFFFHLRWFDEQKDAEVDHRVHPDRPLSRKVVTLAELRPLGIAAVSAEGLGALMLGAVPLAWWTAAFGYSLLMRVEFFARSWLRSRIVVYGISHVIVVFMLTNFVLSTADLRSWRMGLVSVMLAWFAEIARKLDPAPAGPGADPESLEESYVRELGTSGTSLLLVFILLTGIGFGIDVGLRIGRGHGYLLGMLLAGSLVLTSVTTFWRHPTRETGTKAHKASLLWALIQYALLAATPALG